MSKIHPTAIVSPKAEIGPDCEIGPYAVVEDGVVLGRANRLYSHAVVASGTVLGEGNEVHFGATIGHAPQHKHWSGGETGTRIGDRNVFREYCQVHRGTSPETPTRIGNNNLVMALAHIAHDCQLEDEIVICNNSLLAGHVHVGSRAVLSGSVLVHQFSRIGRCAMVGGLSGVPRDVPPYMMAVGNRPCLVVGLNTIGLRRAGLSNDARTSLRQAYKILFRSGHLLPDAVERIEAIGTPEAKHLADFVRASKRGILAGARSDDEVVEVDGIEIGEE